MPAHPKFDRILPMPPVQKKLRILIVSPYFFPENFRINDVAQDLAKKSHEVSVLTGQPNYPHPDFFNEFRNKKIKNHVWENIKIYRVPIITRGNGGGFRRILNYFSFTFSATLWVLRNAKNRQFDVVLTWASSPITSAIPSIVLRKRKKIPHAIWIQDMWPDTLADLGILKSTYLLNLLNRLVLFIYNRSDIIWSQSSGFQKTIASRIPAHQRVEILYNWGDENLASITKPTIKEDSRLKILYAGNLGQAQLLDRLVSIIELLKDENIFWTFIGGGSLEGWLRDEISKRNLDSSAQVIARVSPDVIPHFANWADILLLSLDAKGCFGLTIPSKLQTYMLWQKPILGLVGGDAAAEIEKAQCGLTANPDNLKSFVQKIHQFLEMPIEQRQTYGENARRYAIRYFSKKEILDTLEQDLLSL